MTKNPWLTILGVNECGLTIADLAMLADAEVIVGGKRHLELLGSRNSCASLIQWPSPMSSLYPTILGLRGSRVFILATGDPMYYGIGSTLCRLIDISEMRIIPAPSAFSLVASKIGWDLSACDMISLHGRSFVSIVPYVRPNNRIIALSWDAKTPSRIAEYLVDNGYQFSSMYVLEAIGGPNERITKTVADKFKLQDVSNLNTVAIEVVPGVNPRIQSLGFGLSDALFVHDGQITKKEIRAITLAALAPLGNELLLDIGAGSGSISIEWMLADRRNCAIAIECCKRRSQNIVANANSLGVPGIEVIQGFAPSSIPLDVKPNAIFIGGGVANGQIFDVALDLLSKGGRLVANAVTIDGEEELIRRYSKEGGSLTRIGVERVAPIGAHKGFVPARTIMQWKFEK